MQPKKPSWEGTILAFMMTLSVLMGSAYVIALNFRLPIPWLALVALAVAIAIGARVHRQRSM
jgi:hypothetical protein